VGRFRGNAAAGLPAGGQLVAEQVHQQAVVEAAVAAGVPPSVLAAGVSPGAVTAVDDLSVVMIASVAHLDDQELPGGAGNWS
jgi:hypothetical protein